METIGRNTRYGWCKYWEESDGTRNTFYSDHYNKVRKAKGVDIINETHFNGKEHGFDSDNELSTSLGKGKLIIFSDGKKAFVDSVYKHFDMGYYYMIMYYNIMDNGLRSHGTLFYKNINCHNPDILKLIDENKDIKFFDSTIDDKLDIIINNRKNENLSTIIHINSKDVESYNGKYDILDIQDNILTINDKIKYAKDHNEYLCISGNKIDVQSDKFKNFTFIDIVGLDDKSDIIYFHRNYE